MNKKVRPERRGGGNIHGTTVRAQLLPQREKHNARHTERERERPGTQFSRITQNLTETKIIIIIKNLSWAALIRINTVVG